MDKFHTKPEVVARCLAALEFPMSAYDCVIDPSAGAGAFFSAVPHRRKIGLDISPEHPQVRQADWLEFQVSPRRKAVLVVGNPPFGRYHKLSSQFIRRAMSFGNVRTVAFVLPNVYRKHTRQRIIPADWRVASVADLGENAFTIGGEDYHIPASFFVFDRSPGRDLRAAAPARPETRDFRFGGRGDFDLFVFGAAPHRTTRNPAANNRGHFIKAKIPVPELARRIAETPWVGNSCASGGVFWLTQAEFAAQYAGRHGRGLTRAGGEW